ncbi:MAG TPA: hypothetical protein VLH08_15815, partial [Acidobacteriota bacterium]|nr:hypothetical protein [Acidobacteriota bacterium]
MQTKFQKVILFLTTYKNQLLTAICAGFIILLTVGVYWAQENLRWMHNQIQHHEWKIPSTVYAEAPALYSGNTLSLDWCVQYLKNLEYLQTADAVVKPGQFAIRKEGLVYYPRQSSPQLKNSAILISFKKTSIDRIVELKTGKEISRATLETVALADLYGRRWEKQKLLKLQ